MIKDNYFSYCPWTKVLHFLKKPIIKNLYRGLVPKSFRKKFECFVDEKQQVYTAEQFHTFIQFYLDKKLSAFHLEPVKKELVGKKIIWQYWAQGIENCPPIVKACFSSVDHFKGEYEIIRLDDNNLSDYLHLPQFILDKKNLNSNFKHAFFADLIRIALLDVYGGVWLDATIFLTEKFPNKITGMDYFMFHRSPDTLCKEKWVQYDPAYFGWKDSHKVNVLNSFIVAKKENKVIHLLFELLMNFWRVQDTIPHYFFFQIMYDELFHHNHLKENLCEVIDDTLPHLLHYNLNADFDKHEFDMIKEKIGIHKLRYIKSIKSGSYYEYLINFEYKGFGDNNDQ